MPCPLALFLGLGAGCSTRCGCRSARAGPAPTSSSCTTPTGVCRVWLAPSCLTLTTMDDAVFPQDLSAARCDLMRARPEAASLSCPPPRRALRRPHPLREEGVSCEQHGMPSRRGLRRHRHAQGRAHGRARRRDGRGGCHPRLLRPPVPATAREITGPKGLLAWPTKRLVERAMDAELTDHLGRSISSRAACGSRSRAIAGGRSSRRSCLGSSGASTGSTSGSSRCTRAARRCATSRRTCASCTGSRSATT
jgi:hypothetical protein